MGERHGSGHEREPRERKRQVAGLHGRIPRRRFHTLAKPAACDWAICRCASIHSLTCSAGSSEISEMPAWPPPTTKKRSPTLITCKVDVCVKKVDSTTDTSFFWVLSSR